MSEKQTLPPSKWWLADDLRDLPAVGACYVAYSGDRVMYVGSSGNLRIRMFEHLTGGESARYFKTPHWMNVPDVKVKCKLSNKYGEWRMLELRLIKRLKPPYNTK